MRATGGGSKQLAFVCIACSWPRVELESNVACLGKMPFFGLRLRVVEKQLQAMRHPQKLAITFFTEF